jgi:hypothetical protein
MVRERATAYYLMLQITAANFFVVDASAPKKSH